MKKTVLFSRGYRTNALHNLLLCKSLRYIKDLCMMLCNGVEHSVAPSACWHVLSASVPCMCQLLECSRTPTCASVNICMPLSAWRLLYMQCTYSHPKSVQCYMWGPTSLGHVCIQNYVGVPPRRLRDHAASLTKSAPLACCSTFAT